MSEPSLLHSNDATDNTTQDTSNGTGEETFACSYCPNTFRSSVDQLKHERGHKLSPNRVYKCEKCPEQFPKKVLLSQHMSSNHSASDMPKSTGLQCDICFKEFTRKDHMKRHKNNIHFGIRSPKAGRVCNICQKEFSSVSHLRYHRRRFHDSEEEEEEEGATDNAVSKNAIECMVCAKKFSRQDSLTRHIAAMHSATAKNSSGKTTSDAEVHKCDVCSESFSQSEDLRLHKESIHKDETVDANCHKCNVCSTEFEQVKLLEEHMLMDHAGKCEVAKSHKCDRCSEMFNQKALLKEHKQKIHGVVEGSPVVHKCDRCMMMFSKRALLKEHKLMIHQVTEEIPVSHKCDICCKEFRQSSYLMHHKLKIHGIKPLTDGYKCDICAEVFIKCENLEEHERDRHKLTMNFKCEICSYEFNSQTKLKNHKRRLHGTKEEYACEVCAKKFTREDSVIRHILAQHPTRTDIVDKMKKKDSYKEALETEVAEEEMLTQDIEKTTRTDIVDKIKKKASDKEALEKEEAEEEMLTQDIKKSKLKRDRDQDEAKEDVENFKCGTCYKQFRYIGFLKLHTKRCHNNSKSYKCDKCPKVYSELKVLKNHKRRFHTGKAEFACEVCSKQFVRLANVKRHFADAHADAADLPPKRQKYQFVYNCDVCSEEFSESELLKEHKRDVHGGEMEMGDSRCDVCSMELGTSGLLKLHKLNVHNKIQNAGDPNAEASSKDVNNLMHQRAGTMTGIIRCEICSDEFQNGDLLKLHTQNVHGDRTKHHHHQCDLCSDECDICSQYSSANENLTPDDERNNRKVDKSAEPKKDPSCQDEGALGVKPVKRSDYQTDDIVEDHPVAVEGGIVKSIPTASQPRHRCDLCPEVFKRSALLIQHMQIMHKARKVPEVHECDICSKTFRQSSYLAHHKQNIHNIKPPVEIYACDVCSQEFQQRKELENHKYEIHGIKRTAFCKICSKEFARQANLQRHIRDTHSLKKSNKQASHQRGFAKKTFASKSSSFGRAARKLHKLSSFSSKTAHNCKYCGRGHNSLSLKLRHERTHTGFKPFACPYCDDSFGRTDILLKHKRDQHADKVELKKQSYRCQKCDKAFTSENWFDKHMSLYHAETAASTPKVSYHCEKCNFVFISKTKFDDHTALCRSKTAPTCIECNRRFQSPLGLMHHMRRKHASERVSADKCKKCNKKFSSETERDEHITQCDSEIRQVKGAHSCDKCDIKFDTETELHEHVSKCDADRAQEAYRCDKCDVEFTSDTEFDEHLVKCDSKRVEMAEMYLCDRCCEVSLTKVEFNAHMMQCQPENVQRLFTCDNCTKEFTSETDLNLHAETCPSETCPNCGKKFHTQFVLKEHRKRVHSKTENGAEQHSCEKCGDMFASKADFDKHIQTCEGESVALYRCQHCNRGFTKEWCKIRHERTHTGIKPFACQHCAYTCSRADKLLDHGKLRHPDTIKKPLLRCEKCNKDFTSEVWFEKHMTVYHPDTVLTSTEPDKILDHTKVRRPDTSKKSLFRCEQCNKKFISTILLEKHMTVYHSDNVFTATESDKKLEHAKLKQRPDKITKPLLHCEKCDKDFTSEVWFEKHMTIYHPDDIDLTSTESYRCEKCNTDFMSETKFDKHTVMCRSDTVPTCVPCNKTFLSPLGLLHHRRRIHSEKESTTTKSNGTRDFTSETKFDKNTTTCGSDNKPICILCEKTFLSQLGLLHHRRRIHPEKESTMMESNGNKEVASSTDIKKCDETGLGENKPAAASQQRVLQCKICDENFPTLGRLVKHKARCTKKGGKSVDCKVCGKQFSKVIYLKRHEWIHTGGRPFKCSECDLCYKDRNGLQQHRVLHNGKIYKCNICQKIFARKISLRRHAQRVVPCKKREKSASSNVAGQPSAAKGADQSLRPGSQGNDKSSKMESDDEHSEASKSNGEGHIFDEMFAPPPVRRGGKDMLIPDKTPIAYAEKSEETIASTSDGDVGQDEDEEILSSSSVGSGRKDKIASDRQVLQYEKISPPSPVRRGRKDRRIPDATIIRKIDREQTDTSASDEQSQRPVFARPLMRRGRKNRRVPYSKIAHGAPTDTSDTSDADTEERDTSINRVRDRCPSCQKIFMHPQALREHKSQCGAKHLKRSSGKDTLFDVKHILSKSKAEGVYKCNDCEETFKDIITLGVHSCCKKDLHHCQQCEDCFEDQNTLELHEKTHVKTTLRESEERNMQEKIVFEELTSVAKEGCENDIADSLEESSDMTISNGSTLKDRDVEHESTNLNNSSKIRDVVGSTAEEHKSAINKLINDSRDRTVAMDSKNMSMQKSRNVAVAMDTQNKPMTCRKSEESTTNTGYHCTDCQKSFESFADCLNHERSHRGDKAVMELSCRDKESYLTGSTAVGYNCTVCKKNFTRFAECFDHERTHQCEKLSLDEKVELCSYTCGYCKAVFQTKLSLTVHMVSHKERNNNDTSAVEGTLPYACQQCDKRFTSLTECWKHEQIHICEDTCANGESSMDSDPSGSIWLSDTTDKDTSADGSASQESSPDRKSKDTELMFRVSPEKSSLRFDGMSTTCSDGCKTRSPKKRATWISPHRDHTSIQKNSSQKNSFTELLSRRTPEKEALNFEVLSPSPSWTPPNRATCAKQRSASKRKSSPFDKSSAKESLSRVTTPVKSALDSEVVSPSGSEASSIRTRTGRTVVTPLRYRECVDGTESEGDGSEWEELEDEEDLEDLEEKEEEGMEGIEEAEEMKDEGKEDKEEEVDGGVGDNVQAEATANIKSVPETTQEQMSMQSANVKKRRGRPSKAHLIMEEKIGKECGKVVEKVQNKDTVDIDNGFSVPETSQVQKRTQDAKVKKRRGRPSKSHLVTLEKVGKEYGKVVEKVQNKDTVDIDNGFSVPKTSQVQKRAQGANVKKRRGRPMKINLVTEEKNDKQDGKVVEKARKKNHVDFDNTSSVPGTSQGPMRRQGANVKKRRGRPVKIPFVTRRDSLRSRMLSKATRASRHVRQKMSEEVDLDEELDEDMANETEDEVDDDKAQRQARTKLKSSKEGKSGQSRGRLRKVHLLAKQEQTAGANDTTAHGKGKPRKVLARYKGLRNRKPQSKDAREASQVPRRGVQQQHQGNQLGDLYLQVKAVAIKRRQWALAEHRKGHTHKCDLCPATFVGEASLNQHQKVHQRNGNFKCTKCTASFNVPLHLRSHDRLHTGSLLQCNYCPKVSIWADGLVRHMASQHADEIK